jgi:hypothetical protein
MPTPLTAEKIARKQQFLSIVAELLQAHNKVFGTEPAFEEMNLTNQEIKTWLRFNAALVGARWIAGRDLPSPGGKRYTPGHIEKVLT